jgi:hypothetical protein
VAAKSPQPSVFKLPRAPGITQLLALFREHFFDLGKYRTRIDDWKTIEGDRLEHRARRAVQRIKASGRGGHARGSQRRELAAIQEHLSLPIGCSRGITQTCPGPMNSFRQVYSAIWAEGPSHLTPLASAS